MFINLLMYRS